MKKKSLASVKTFFFSEKEQSYCTVGCIQKFLLGKPKKWANVSTLFASYYSRAKPLKYITSLILAVKFRYTSSFHIL
jgi:hypothetical protein